MTGVVLSVAASVGWEMAGVKGDTDVFGRAGEATNWNCFGVEACVCVADWTEAADGAGLGEEGMLCANTCGDGCWAVRIIG